MANKRQINYLGLCKTFNTAYGKLRKVSLGPDDVKKINDLANENKGWVNVLVKIKDNGDPDKADFWLEIDEWKPNGPKEKLPF